MTEYAAFLRAVNVGGTGKLPMAELRQMCEKIGFAEVRTYIASGNVLFTSDGSRRILKAALEDSLQTYADKPVRVIVRTAAELRDVLECGFLHQIVDFHLAGTVGQDDRRHPPAVGVPKALLCPAVTGAGSPQGLAHPNTSSQGAIKIDRHS